MCGTGCAAQGGLNFVRNLVDNKNRGMGGGQRITCHEVAEYFFCPRKLYIRALGANPHGDDLEVGSAYHALVARAAERQARQLAEERDFTERLLREGKLAPAMAAGLPEALVFLRGLPSEGDNAAVLTFEEADGDEKKEIKLSPYDWLRRFLEAHPKVIELDEVAGEAPAGPEAPAITRGGDDELHRKAVALQEQAAKSGQTLSYAEALIQAAKK